MRINLPESHLFTFFNEVRSNFGKKALSKKHIAYGFTLVELLVVISIIVIVIGAIVPSFSRYIFQQNQKQVQEKLKSDLRDLQNKALTGANSDTLLSGNPAIYWGLRFTNLSALRYSTYTPFISNSLDCTTAGNYSTANFGSTTLTDFNVVSSSFGGATVGCIFFSMADGTITKNGGGSSIIVAPSSDTNLVDGDCISVKTTPTGLVYADQSQACN